MASSCHIVSLNTAPPQKLCMWYFLSWLLSSSHIEPVHVVSSHSAVKGSLS